MPFQFWPGFNKRIARRIIRCIAILQFEVWLVMQSDISERQSCRKCFMYTCSLKCILVLADKLLHMLFLQFKVDCFTLFASCATVVSNC